MPCARSKTIASSLCSRAGSPSVGGGARELQFLQQRVEASIGFEAQEQRIVGDAGQSAVALLIGAVQPLERLLRFAAKRVNLRNLVGHVGGVLGDEFLQRP